MWEEQSMGSQTLEILRQGIWASITGGWFYDPSQDVFCNTAHLYIWLFLLCLPFSIYMYLPPSQVVWYIYCGTVAFALAAIKFTNYFLHHIYDTKDCEQEVVTENGQKREEEGIELQDLSPKEGERNLGDITIRSETEFLQDLTGSAENKVSGDQPAGSLNTYKLLSEVRVLPSTDSLESSEFQQLEMNGGSGKKVPSTIDLKVDVHRKNSSESSDAPVSPIERKARQKNHGRKSDRRHQRSKTDGFVSVTIKDDSPVVVSTGKLFPQGSADMTDHDNNLLTHQRPSSRSIESDQEPSSYGESSGRRHSNFAVSSLNYLPVTAQTDIKPTGSLELGYIDKNPNQSLNSEGFYFKQKANDGVRRFKSAALETCCPPTSTLKVHPNSLEVIGCKNAKNPLPPPSTSLVRNQHLNLCPYYGSEIVYPIAEQSDEHQTSHGPDTDMESLTHVSDSDFEENNQASRSPLLYAKLSKASKAVPYHEHYPKRKKTAADIERASSTSKDALLDLEISNSSITSDKLDSYATDNDVSDKKLSPGSNMSVSSLEFDDRTNFMLKKLANERGLGRKRHSEPGEAEQKKFRGGIVRKKNIKKTRRRPSAEQMVTGAAASSSLVELDLDWLFANENNRLPLRKEPLKSEEDFINSIPVSLEQDVSLVLKDSVPSGGSTSVIPKKTASKDVDKKLPKSESEKCKACSRSNSEAKTKSLKENKVTQTVPLKDTLSLEEIDNIPSSSRTLMANTPSRKSFQKSQSFKNEEASSSGSNNELSTLLPPTAPPLLSALLTKREAPSTSYPGDSYVHFRKRRTRSAGRKRSNPVAKRDMAIASSLTAGYGTHGAKNFNDTSEGSVHCFIDEHGNYVTYTFGDRAIINNLPQPDPPTPVERSALTVPTMWGSMDSVGSSSVSTVMDVLRERNENRTDRTPAEPISRDLQAIEIRNLLGMHEVPDAVSTEINGSDLIVKLDDTAQMPRSHFKFIKVNMNDSNAKTKSYYKVKLLPGCFIKVTLDRLKLLALLDRNLTASETVISVFLGTIVSVLGAILLFLNFYKDLAAFAFCFIIASCQYSLLKSVQPDSASPIHGFNRLIAYSRPIYFSLICLVILFLHLNIDGDPGQHLLIMARDFFVFFILFFPFLFSFGLFPQINTFVLYVLEQIDIHIFGGNAMCSLVASVYCVCRSAISVIILSGLSYLALSENQDVLFSMFCACLVASCYHLSRCASDPAHVWNLIKKHMMWLPDIYREQSVYFNEQSVLYEKKNNEVSGKSDEVVNFTSDKPETRHKGDHVDPLPKQLQETVNARLKNDVIVCSVIAVLVFAIHASTVFTVLQPELNIVLCSIACGVGLVVHYVIPQLRKQLPWVCIARPIFKPDEYAKYQIREAARIMWFERVYVYLCFFERNILYPLLVLSALTGDKEKIVKTNPNFGPFILVVCGMKLLRSSYSDQNSQYLIVTFSALFFNYDYGYLVDSFLVQYFFMSIVYHKVFEFLLKIQFVITYIAPWQITWGSAFHAFAQPFSVPHSAMLFLQSILSAVFSTPLTPFLGSAIFITSYVRPVKFWERDYNTRRVDHSNTPLSSHLDRNLGADDNNLNSIFYEHLTRSLQKSLFGDLAMGRWGLFNQGDIFVMASDYLNCLVHIIGIGNGFVTFQVRGLEFRGTYCQQREVEAITEGVENDEGCCCTCCCNTGHLPNMLSINAAFNQRWLAWEVTAAKYILEGYSISDNSVVSMLQVFEFRKVLISYYVKSIIFYTIRSPKLEEWLNSEVINKTLRVIWKPNFVDLDPVFNHNIDEDYDIQHNGMTKTMFLHIHGEWIHYCLEKRGKISKKQRVILLCFALSLLGRRTLGAVSQNMVSSVEFFLYGLHALFKGDFRITCARDEWVFTDMDLLKTVVAPAVRMSLKLHQDHFMSPDEYEVLPTLYEAICKHEQELVISHEGDPMWRNAVLSGTPSLLALRHVFDEGTDEYKIIMLNKRYLSFRVIKVNRECVRGLWAGQQQELVYFRNRNPERGSIQNAKQALRNIINSSCDQPIGYPIYVSPLTTSYSETNEQYCSLVGGSVSIKKIRNYLFGVLRKVRKRCVEGCSSGASIRDDIGMGNEGVYAMSATLSSLNSSQPIDARMVDSIGRRSAVGRNTFPGANRSSFASGGKPTSSTLVSLASLFKERDERAVSQAPDAQGRTDERLGDVMDGSDKEVVAPTRAKILDPNVVFDGINLGRRIDVIWPTEYMRIRGGRSYWNNWLPEAGMDGAIVHKWTPCHRNPNKRSHVDKTILLLQIDDKFVPIAESGVQILETDPT